MPPSSFKNHPKNHLIWRLKVREKVKLNKFKKHKKPMPSQKLLLLKMPLQLKMRALLLRLLPPRLLPQLKVLEVHQIFNLIFKHLLINSVSQCQKKSFNLDQMKPFLLNWSKLLWKMVRLRLTNSKSAKNNLWRRWYRLALVETKPNAG
jgi:hypothetical protein